MPRKVLHLVSSYGVSGVNSNLKFVARKMKERNWQAYLYQYAHRNGDAWRFIDDGLAVNSVPHLPVWSKRMKTRWIIYYLKKVLQRIRPDLIHAHSFDADLIALRASAELRLPVVVTCQSFSYIDWAKMYAAHYAKWKSRLKVVVSVSHAMAREIKILPEFADIPHEVIYNVPAERFFSITNENVRQARRDQLGLKPDDVLIACTATFHPVKGHIVLADAFAAVATRCQRAKLILIGDTLGQPEYLRIKQQVEDSLKDPKYCGRFEIIQGCYDAEPILRATDIYVQPSFMEALGVATAEAMAMGIPVVVSSVGGLKEIVTEGVTGFQVEAGDSGQLAAALQRLIEDPYLRQRMGDAAAGYAGVHFLPDTAADRYAAVYERALHS